MLFLLTDIGIEQHMKPDIAKLLRKLVFFPLEDGIAELVDLLQGLGAKRLVCLLPVPWTFLSQFIKDVKNASESLKLLFSCMHNFQ